MAPTPTPTTTTLPGGGTTTFVPPTKPGAALPGNGLTPTVLPNEMLGSQAFSLNPNGQDQAGNPTYGPGAWTVTTSSGASNVHDQVQKLWTLTPQEVEQLQIQLYQGGYYDDSIYKQHANPSWGVADTATQQAYYQALLETTRAPGKTVQQVIQAGQERNQGRLAALQTSGQVVDLSPDVVSIPQINLSDPATLHLVANAASQALTGKDMTDAERAKFADAIQSQQRAQGETDQSNARAAADIRAGVQRDAAGRQAKGPQATDQELTAFKNVISGEIVGPLSAFAAAPAYGQMAAKLNEYGISSDTLAKWADEARRDGAAVPSLTSPQGIDMVVDHHIKALYSQTGGDWNSVAMYFLGDIDASMKASRGGAGFGGTNLPVPGQPTGRLGPQHATTAPGRTPAQTALFGRGTGPTPAAANGADTYGGGPTPGPVQVNTGAPGQPLQPLAAQVTSSMGRMLGHAMGAQSGVTGDNTPIFTGGGEQTSIDASAQAQEDVKREHPQDVYEHSMMSVLQALDAMVARRG